MKHTNTIDAGGYALKNLKDGVDPQDAVTFAQLNALLQGWKWKEPVRVATTANITLAGLQTIDGVSLAAGDRVLVKNQSTTSANGIYIAGAGAWPRATDFDLGAEALLATCFVSEGATQGNTGWTMTTDGPITIGSTALNFTQTTGGTAYTSGAGIVISSGVIAIDPTVVTRKVSANIGDGVSTTLTVTHNLGTLDLVVSVRSVATGEQVLVDNVANSINTVQLTFGQPPSAGQYRVTVAG